MPREIKVKVYQFDELDDKAKERARTWWRESSSDKLDHIVDDAKHCLSLAGFTVERVFYSGFYSQGDGAMFEGGWKAEDVKPGKMKEEAPTDKTLHKIAETMERIAQGYKSAFMRVKHRGHYYHENCTVFEIGDTVTDFGEKEIPPEIAEEIEETSKKAMRWIYAQLQKEYEYQDEDAQVDENIRANEYDFTVDGKRSVVIS